MKTKQQRIDTLNSQIQRELAKEEPDTKYIQDLRTELYFLDFKPQEPVSYKEALEQAAKEAMEISTERERVKVELREKAAEKAKQDSLGKGFQMGDRMLAEALSERFRRNFLTGMVGDE